MIADLIPRVAGLMAEEDHPYHPRSSLSGPMHRPDVDTRCLRSMVYWALDYPKKPMPDRAYLIFDDGNHHAEMIKNWIKKSERFRVHSEEMPVEVCGRRGHIDALIEDTQEKRDYLCEIKSTNYFSFQRLWKGEELPWDYIHQTCDYFFGLQQNYPSLNEGIILFKDKNTASMIEMWLEYKALTDRCVVTKMIRSTGETSKINREIEWPIVAESNLKFKTIEDHAQAKEIPDRPYTRDSWRCQYCRYNDEVCWADFEEEFKALKTDVVMDNEEFIDMVALFQEEKMHEANARERKEEFGEKIKAIMKENQVRKGSAGPYLIDWRFTKVKAYEVPAREQQALYVTIKKETKGKKEKKAA